MVMMVADTYLPMSLFVPDMTDDQFADFCEQYEHYRLEYTAEGELLIMLPTDPETGFRNSLINYQLVSWWRDSRLGYVVGSSTGFKLPNGARRSPDAAWISTKTVDCPEFVIELLSPSDRPNKVRAKMREWIENGAELAWMIDPRKQTVTVYRPGQAPEVRANVVEIRGEGPVAGFTLHLAEIWAIA